MGVLMEIFSIKTFLTGVIAFSTTTYWLTVKKESDRKGFLELSHLMENTREDRTEVRKMIRKNKISMAEGKGKYHNPTHHNSHVDSVCRAFDILGFFHRRKLVDRKYVCEMYAPPFMELYENFLKEYVEHLRQPHLRGKTHYWELVNFYDWCCNNEVSKRHPTKHDNKCWNWFDVMDV
jgi:hypothetical protein